MPLRSTIPRSCWTENPDWWSKILIYTRTYCLIRSTFNINTCLFDYFCCHHFVFEHPCHLPHHSILLFHHLYFIPSCLNCSSPRITLHHILRRPLLLVITSTLRLITIRLLIFLTPSSSPFPSSPHPSSHPFPSLPVL